VILDSKHGTHNIFAQTDGTELDELRDLCPVRSGADLSADGSATPRTMLVLLAPYVGFDRRRTLDNVEPTAASGLRALAVPSSLRAWAAAQRER
jgi:hypothetical protein